MITLFIEFLKSFVNNQRPTNARVRVVEIEMTTLYEHIRLGIRIRFEKAQALWEVAPSTTLFYIRANF